MSYESLSSIGRAVATVIELTYRDKWLKTQANRLPDYTPMDLTETIRKYKSKLSEDTKAAVENYLKPPASRSMGYGIYKRAVWLEWLQQHLRINPSDYTVFNKLELNFGNQEIENVDWQLLDYHHI